MKLLAILATVSLAAFASPTNRPNLPTIQEETRWHGWVPSGQVVEINNIHGNVRAEPASGDEIEVIAIKRGSSDPAQVDINVVEHKGGVTICAVYPDADPGHPFDCRPSHGGGFRQASTSDSTASIRWENGGGGDVVLNDLRVDFIVRLPKRLRFIGRTVDGDVSAHLLEQDVEAHSVMGDVRVDLNSTPGAEVRAESVNGHISSEFPLSMRCNSNHGMLASGHVGHSRRTLRLTTDTGDIHLLRPILDQLQEL
jgi:Putative adhesin